MRSLDLQPISWYSFLQPQKFQYMKFMNQFNDQLPIVAMILLHLFLHPAVSIYEIDIIHFSWVYQTNLMTISQLSCHLSWLEPCTGFAKVRV